MKLTEVSLLNNISDTSNSNERLTHTMEILKGTYRGPQNTGNKMSVKGEGTDEIFQIRGLVRRHFRL